MDYTMITQGLSKWAIDRYWIKNKYLPSFLIKMAMKHMGREYILTTKIPFAKALYDGMASWS